MNILVTLDAKYIKPLKVMFQSLFLNNGGEHFDIFLMHSTLTDSELDGIVSFAAQNGHKVIPIGIGKECFQDAPLTKHYTKEIYYRLLAYRFLPRELDRILYLDPDILVINGVRELYDTDLSGYLYAAAYHNIVPTKEINRIRLKSYELEKYFNSGVLLMNLPLQRKKVKEKDIYEYVEENKGRLILPDQDIINSLYAKEIKAVSEVKYNYEARHYKFYKITSRGMVDMDYVLHDTAILHFCGRRKPWKKNYSGEFYSLYKHYEKIALG